MTVVAVLSGDVQSEPWRCRMIALRGIAMGVQGGGFGLTVPKACAAVNECSR
jgi:hypothetical protein